MAAAPLIWINGFPGTGKYTVAKQLVAILGNERAVLIDSHQLIDPVEADMARNNPEHLNIRLHPDYNIRRREKRDVILEQFARDASMFSRMIIFTGKYHFRTPSGYILGINAASLTTMADFQSDNNLGQDVAMEYVKAARESERPFLPVNMTCNIEENMRRVQSVERQQSSSRKLLDCEELKAMWTRSKLLCFRDMESLDLDVTQRSPQETAMVLRDYVSRNLWKDVGLVL